jgi:hypothetical protein
MKALWKWNSNEIVSQYTKMVFVAHLKNKMRFSYRNFKFKLPLNCTDGTTLPQYGIYKKQNTGTKLNKSISSAHIIQPKNAFNSPNDHENAMHYLFTCGLPLINWYPMSKNTVSTEKRSFVGSSLWSQIQCILQKNFYRNESPLKLYWRIVSHLSYKV